MEMELSPLERDGTSYPLSILAARVGISSDLPKMVFVGSVSDADVAEVRGIAASNRGRSPLPQFFGQSPGVTIPRSSAIKNRLSQRAQNDFADAGRQQFIRQHSNIKHPKSLPFVARQASFTRSASPALPAPKNRSPSRDFR